MSRKLAILVLLLASALPAIAQAQIRIGPQIPAPAGIEVPRDGVTIPVKDMGGRPIVGLEINGKGPFRFILDTGAVTTVVSDELSRELSLTPLGGVQVKSVGGEPAPAMVVIRDLRIGGVRLEGVIAAAMPLGALLKGEDAPRGILSALSFPGCLLTYDYPGKRILIKRGAMEAADARSVFQYSEDHVLPTVPVRVAGHDTQVHLDTGSPFGLVLPVRFLTELPLASQPKEVGKARTGGGEFTVSSARVDGTIELGKYKLDLDEVRFSDARPGPGPAIGNLGYDALRHFVVTLDSQNRRIRIDQ